MRRRVHVEEEVGELNIVPYLDIVVNLVMFMLLSMTGLIALGVLNVSAPKLGAEASQANPDEKPKLLLTSKAKAMIEDIEYNALRLENLLGRAAAGEANPLESQQAG